MLTMQTILDLAMWLLIAVLVLFTFSQFVLVVRGERQARRQERERQHEPWTQMQPPDDDHRY